MGRLVRKPKLAEAEPPPQTGGFERHVPSPDPRQRLTACRSGRR